MDIDTFFRVFSLIYLVIVMSTRGFLIQHWLQARRERMSKPSIREVVEIQGLAFVVFASIVSFGMMVAIILYFLDKPWMHWSILQIPEWVRWGGLILGIAVFPFHVWVHKTLGQAMLEHSLATTGPYRRVRHPMFISTGIVLISVSIIASNLLLLLSIIGFVFLMIIYAPREEKLLIEEFGEQYLDYMKSTGRFIPKIKQESNLRK